MGKVRVELCPHFLCDLRMALRVILWVYLSLFCIFGKVPYFIDKPDPINRFDGWGINDCERTEAAGVQCKEKPPPSTTPPPTTTPRWEASRPKNMSTRHLLGVFMTWNFQTKLTKKVKNKTFKIMSTLNLLCILILTRCQLVYCLLYLGSKVQFTLC